MDEKSISRRPSSTYRLQLRSGLTLRKLRGLTDYFHALGISDLHLSPVFKADSSSSDAGAVVDFDDIDPRVGSIEELAELAEDLRRRGMGILLDVVAGHMAASPTENRWWRDVLELGPRSIFAPFFDIDWNHRDPELRGRVLVPVLTTPYREAIESGELVLTRTMDGLFVAYQRLRYPLSPWSWSAALEGAVDDLRLQTLLAAMQAMAEQSDVPFSEAAWKEKESLKQRALALLHASQPLVRIDRMLAEVSSSPERLRSVLEQQAFRLRHHREASSRINYRRFLDVDDLVALRVEEPGVFEKAHGFLFHLVAQGWIGGLRIGQVDALFDPKGYLENLPRDRYLVVEKVLDRHERLPADWPVAGTTGYEISSLIQRIFIDPAGERALRRLFGELAGVNGEEESFQDVVCRSRLDVLDRSFGDELTRVAEDLLSATRDSAGADAAALENVRDALRALVSCFSVYRTYRRPHETRWDDWDARVLGSARSLAKRRHPERSEVLDRVAAVLARGEPSDAAMRLQQLTASVAARGTEAVAFHRYFPLASLNETGCGPMELGSSLEEFHERNRERARQWPHGLTATTPDDATRSEDARSRIHVVSEIPGPWRDALARWRRWNRPHRKNHGTGDVPDAVEEYLLYQTLLGTWPLEPLDPASHRDYVERTTSSMIEALRKARRKTRGYDPDHVYENWIGDFVSRLLDPKSSLRFLDDFASFELKIRGPGLLNALSQLVLKGTVPGVPEFHQGTEAWELVAPNPSRAIDFEERRNRLLAIVEEAKDDGESRFIERGLEKLEDGRLKFYLTWRLLQIRRERPNLFAEGDYHPLTVEGDRAGQVVAFSRTASPGSMIVAVARFFTRLPSPPVGDAAWEGTHLVLPEAGRLAYRDALSGRSLCPERDRLPVGELFTSLPFAVLVSSDRR